MENLPWIIDGHNDTLTSLYAPAPGKERSFFTESQFGHLDLPRARRGGLSGGFFAIFTSAPSGWPDRDLRNLTTFTEDGYIVTECKPIPHDHAVNFTDSVIAFARELEAQSSEIKIVTSYAELEQCLTNGIFAMILHIEGAEAIRPDLSNLEEYYRKGVRSLGPVWSRSNVFAHGVPFRFPGSPDTGDCLLGAGKALVEACNEVGILIDLAHLNEKGFWDVAALSTTPLVVTHADVHAICPSTRNLTDRQIDAVADSGGVIGINFETGSTHPRASFDSNVPVTQITRHIDYITQRVGVDHVAFGSDFDGADMPDCLKDVSLLPGLVAALRESGYDETAIGKIAGKNWLRVLRTTWRG